MEMGRYPLGFLLRENLLPCSSYLPLGVPNGSLLGQHQADFLAPLPGRRSTSTRGVSHSQSFYFVIVLLILFLFTFLYRKYKKISYSFYSSCFIYLLCSVKNTKKLVVAFISVMSMSSSFTMSPEEMVFTFKQGGEESFKEAWFRINNSYEKTEPRMTLALLLRSFYFGLVLRYRYALDTL